MATPHYQTLATVVLAFVLAAFVVRASHAVIRRMLDRLDIQDENRAAIQTRARKVTRALTLMAYSIAAAASISMALSRFGIGEPSWDPGVVARWFVRHGINIIIIVVGATFVARLTHLAVEQLQFKIGRRRAQTDLEWQRRAATIGGILNSLVTGAVGFVATLMLLRELSIDVVPILTGAGIAGLAVGFGAQNLVRDIISGFFLILEDQVRVGDAVKINGVGGTVEQINLRTIALRDGEGAVQVFPNGTIHALANLSKQFAYAIVDVRVAYGENLDRVMETMREVGASMAQDPAWRALLLAPLDVLGVQSLAHGYATIRVTLKTLPLNQGGVASELRRRFLEAFVALGIKPFAT